MIEPTVGRVVWYFPHGAIEEEYAPFAATIAQVNKDGTINIGYLNDVGRSCNATDVQLYQGEEEPPKGAFCTWMPYQLDQAAKTEAAERQQRETQEAAERGYSADSHEYAQREQTEE